MRLCGQRRLLAAVLALVMIGAAACGDDDSDTTSRDDEAPPEREEDETDETVVELAGDPVVIGVVFDADNPTGNTPEIRDGAEAIAAYLNAEENGIAGHPVEVVACNVRNDTATAAQCARTFADEGVVAVVGISGVWADNGAPIINQAGILNMTVPLGGPEILGETSYPAVGGTVVNSAVLAKHLIAEQVDAVSGIYVNIAAAEAFVKNAFFGPLEAAGITSLNGVAAEPTTTDYSPIVQKATSNDPDAIFLALGTDAAIRVVQAAEGSGALENTQFAGPSAIANPALFEALGDAAEGMLFSSDYESIDGDTPDAKKLREILGEYGEGAAEEPSYLALYPIRPILVLKALGDDLGEAALSASDFLEAMKTVQDLDLFMGPTISADKTVPNLDHIRVTSGYVQRYEDGKLVDVGGGEIKPFDS